VPRIQMKKPERCPSCGHHPFADLGYGMPRLSDELRREVEAGRIVLAGCVVSDDDPVWACAACGIQMWSDGRILEKGEERWR